MDKNIPLSQLIRIGSKLGAKAHLAYSYPDGRTCALGAALVAKTGEPVPQNLSVTECCETLNISISVHTLIASMNDVQGFTREQIVDILEKEGL